MNLADLRHFVARKWDDDLVPRLVDYVRVPAKSPAFDASWSAHGYLDAVAGDAEAWCRAQRIDGMTIEVVAIEGRTPCLLFDVPATGGLGNERTVLFYGHLDKQPEMTGWREHLGPWTPVIEDGKLYGRGSADDGYAIYAALTTIAAVDAQGSARPRWSASSKLARKAAARSAGLSGAADAAIRRRATGRRTGFGLPQLRAAVGDDVAARIGRRHVDRRNPVRRRAFGPRERHRAFVISHCSSVVNRLDDPLRAGAAAGIAR